MTIRKHLLAAASQALDELSELSDRIERRFRTHAERATEVVRLQAVSVVETHRAPRVAMKPELRNVVPGGGIFGQEVPMLDIGDIPDTVRIFREGVQDSDLRVTKIELVRGKYVEVTFETGLTRGFPIFRVEEWKRWQ